MFFVYFLITLAEKISLLAPSNLVTEFKKAFIDLDVKDSASNKFVISYKNRTFTFEDSNNLEKMIKILNSYDPPFDTLKNTYKSIKNMTKNEKIERGLVSFGILFVEDLSKVDIDNENVELNLFMSTDPKLAEEYETPFPGIYGYNSIDKIEYKIKVNGSYAKAIGSVKALILETVNTETLQDYENAENPSFYILSQNHQIKDLKKTLRDVAIEFKDSAQVGIMKYDGDKKQLNALGLEETDLPAILIIRNGLKYREPSATKESLKIFISKYLKNEIEPYILSGEEPKNNSELPVKIIVSKGMEKWTEDKTKDKLIAFSAPWCRYCKELKPVLEELGKIVQEKSNDKILIGSVDMTANEVTGFAIRGYPTVVLIKAETNEKIYFKSGNRDLKSLIEFIRNNGTYKIDLDPKKEETNNTETKQEESKKQDNIRPDLNKIIGEVMKEIERDQKIKAEADQKIKAEANQKIKAEEVAKGDEATKEEL